MFKNGFEKVSSESPKHKKNIRAAVSIAAVGALGLGYVMKRKALSKLLQHRSKNV